MAREGPAHAGPATAGTGMRSPRRQPGLTILFTGLPGAGKSTIAGLVKAKLEETGRVTLLDGDAIRKTISAGLGFSRKDRIENIRRVGNAALEITKADGICICALIAPYREAREEVRQLIAKEGAYVEVFVDTPLAECERRDPKGLYAKARAGLVTAMTGIDDPYEAPECPEIRIETLRVSPEQAADAVLTYLSDHRLLASKVMTS